MRGISKGWLSAATLVSLGLTAVSPVAALERFEFTQVEMAVPVRVVLYTSDKRVASEAARAVFARFHELNAILSDYDPNSELRRLCDSSSEGHPVHVSDDLWRVLLCSQEIARRSRGAFDATVGPLVKLWRNARHTKEFPSSVALERARAKVGYRLMKLAPDRRTVELMRPDMRLDLGGIAKGYAVDEAMKVLRRRGVERMMIDAGGNLGLGDPPPDRVGWRIGVASPVENAPPRQYLSLADRSVSTSGDLRQHAVIDGVRYSHIVDPRTGVALTGRMSVTVVCKNGTTADAHSSALCVLGPEDGLKLIEDEPDAAALIVRVIDGKEKVFQSLRWKELSERK
ncbi:MAG: FAD:protein FMN transferase [Pirellulales bacterium]|nr:FAD:protein FMN transferase [Pirellulales bacterium]